jgi:hypothetical protein
MVPGKGHPGQEMVILVIPNLMRIRGLGFFLQGPVWHHLVVTSIRIIVVQRTLRRLEKLKRDLGIIGPDFDYPMFRYMHPDEILTENPESRVIPLEDLVSLAVIHYVIRSPEEADEHYWEVRIMMRDKPLTLRTDTNEDPRMYFRNPALVELLGERLDTRNM